MHFNPDRTRAKWPLSQKWISEIDPICCPIHVFMLFLDELAQEKDIEESFIVIGWGFKIWSEKWI